ncbi:MAG: CPBP family intramembrane metalloprotease [Candidatus Micrarchaeota archaeon]|nr:CPBP family intramembrane metalloprotease [Candidatus Micrarchaeota archaeon]
MSATEVIERLGLSRKKISLGFVSLGIVIFLALFCLELMVNLISTITGVTINTNVDLLLSSAPLWFFIFTSVIAPINEEIFFRGFLVPRLGIVVSAVIFGLMHASYNSSFGIEIIAAIIFGLVAGYVFKKTNSLYPSIVAHILLNTLAVLAFAVI